MLSWLTGFLHGILSFLNSFLPGDPFSEWIQTNESLSVGLGWLNFFVPISDFVLIFAAYLAVLLLFAGVRFATTKAGNITGQFIGGGK